MNFLTLEGVSKSYGERQLFENINLYINEGQKVALVAKNGTGKTSLLRIIADEERPDAGKVMIHKDIRMAYLPQDPDLPMDVTAFEAVYTSPSPIIRAIARYDKALLLGSTDEELQAAMTDMDRLDAWDYEHTVQQILAELKVDYLDRAVGVLSGGQRKRVALAKALIDSPQFLILDEPTNHLDLEMIEWLEGYLSRSNLTLLMITHDRYFLENVCDSILELEEQELVKYSGTYSEYLIKKAEREDNVYAQTERAKNLYRKELDWMRRQPQARSTKAKSRIDAFFEVEAKAKRKLGSDEVEMDIIMNRLGSKVIELHNVGKWYGEQVLLKNFEYKFKHKDRVGIVGKNGAGKTSFLDLITGRSEPNEGKVVIGDTVVMGYYTQEIYNINEDKKVIDVIRDIAEYIPLKGGKKLSAVQLLERFLFDGPKMQTFVYKLSGGERRRLHLLTILMTNPNVLILDEPTNDLDVMTLQVLEEFLSVYEGCLIIVSHDRHFMDKLVEHTFVFEGNGFVRDYPGNYSAYRAWRDAGGGKPQVETKEAKTTEAAVAAPSSSQAHRANFKEISKVEKEIEKLEEKKRDLENKISNAGSDMDLIIKLSAELGELLPKLEEKEMRWLELQE